MPGYFKKRRGSSGPNKNEEKVQRAKNEEYRARQTGTVSSRLPAVKNLRLHMTFLDARQQVMDEKNINLKPSDAAEFTIACPGRCGRGNFDFSKKISETVDNRLAASEGSAKCLEALYAGAAETCGWELRCRMEIEYLPA